MTQTHIASDRVKIHPIPILKDNYVWAIIDNSTHRTIIVDPGDAKPVIQFLNDQKLSLAAILVTHHHWDHTNGITQLTKFSPAPIIGNIVSASQLVCEKDQISIENFPISFEVISIPGHTLTHLAFYAPSILFCGDTLFAAGCGRLFEGSPEQLYDSLQKIARLADETKIYCAHEYTLNNLRFARLVEPSNQAIVERIASVNEMRNKHLPSLPSSLLDEKNTNPFLRCHIKEVIAHAEHYANKRLKHPTDVFATLRQWKDKF